MNSTNQKGRRSLLRSLTMLVVPALCLTGCGSAGAAQTSHTVASTPPPSRTTPTPPPSGFVHWEADNTTGCIANLDLTSMNLTKAAAKLPALADFVKADSIQKEKPAGVIMYTLNNPQGADGPCSLYDVGAITMVGTDGTQYPTKTVDDYTTNWDSSDDTYDAEYNDLIDRQNTEAQAVAGARTTWFQLVPKLPSTVAHVSVTFDDTVTPIDGINLGK